MPVEQWLYKLPLRLRSLFRRSILENELREEFEYHLNRRIDELVAQGIPADEARNRAMREMEGMEQQIERCREARGVSLIEDLLADIRYSLRAFRKTPALTFVIIASLALGIGANTAIFSVMNAVMLKLLPVREPERLMLLGWRSQKWPEPYLSDLEGNRGHDSGGGVESSNSFALHTYQELKQQDNAFENCFAFASNDESVNVELNGRSESAQLQGVSGDFFEALGVSPVVGRVLFPTDDADSAPPAVVVSDSFWKKHFGEETSIAGKTLTINGEPVSIVGVTPPDFNGVVPGTPMELYIPLSLYQRSWERLNPDAPLSNPTTWWVTIVGRLKPGVTLRQAQVETQLIFSRSLKGAAPNANAPIPSLDLTPAARGLNSLREKFSRSLFLLMGMVGLVLLIACANVGGLLMSRAASRQKEIAVRLSLGASRARVVRQLMTESLLLSALGAFIGILLSLAAGSGLLVLLGGSADFGVNAGVDARVLGFTAAISVMSAIFFGLMPALAATKVDVAPALKETTTQLSGSQKTSRLGKTLVASQVALSLLLLISASLLLGTLNRLQHVELGFNQHALLTFRVRPGLNGYKDLRLANYYSRLQERLQSLAGVQSVSFSLQGPIDGGMSVNTVEIPGYTTEAAPADLHRHIVGPAYFETLRIPIVLGRPLGEGDTEAAPKAAVINQEAVRQYLHGDNPTGKKISYGKNGSRGVFEIVGVAADVKYGSVRNPSPPTVYLPYRQSFFVPQQMIYFVRTPGNPASLANDVRQVGLALDKDVPLVRMRTEDDIVAGSLALERTFALLSSAFSALALLLACVGLYGTVAYGVARRTSEIGVRMALGAERWRILYMVQRETLLLVGIGVLVGLPLAWAATRLLAQRLYGLSPHDAMAIVVSTLLILAVTLLAGYLPARRASRVDPMRALRYE